MLNLRQIAELSDKEQKRLQWFCNSYLNVRLANQKTNRRKASAINQIEAGRPEGEVRCN